MNKKVIVMLTIIILLGGVIFFINRSNKNQIAQNNIEENSELTPEELADKIGEKVDQSYGTENEKRYGYNLENYNMTASVIYEFIEYINDNQYENAYEMIEKDYLIKEKYTLETLKKEFNFSGKEKGIDIRAFEDYGGKYIMLVDIVDFEIDDLVGEDVQVDKPLSKTFTVYKNKKLVPKGDTTEPTLDLTLVKNVNEINIIGLDTLLNKYEIDITGVESLTAELKLSISMIPVLSKDISENNLDEYYLRNRDLIFDIYGVRSFTEFKELSNKVKELKDVKVVKLDLESTKENGKIIELDMLITGDSNIEKVFNLRIIKDKIANSNTFYIIMK